MLCHIVVGMWGVIDAVYPSRLSFLFVVPFGTCLNHDEDLAFW